MDHPLVPPVIWFNGLVLSLPLAILLLAKRPSIWPHLFSSILGIITAIIDTGSSEVQFPAFMLVAFGLFLGFAHPARAWRWGVLLGVWIPLFAGASVFLRHETLSALGQRASALIAFVPAFLGVYAGAGTRFFLTRDTAGRP
jgi:hypothetical protein